MLQARVPVNNFLDFPDGNPVDFALRETNSPRFSSLLPRIMRAPLTRCSAVQMDRRFAGLSKSWIPLPSLILLFSRALGYSSRPLQSHSRPTGQWAAGMAMVCLSLLAVESEAAITFSNPTRTLSSANNKGSSQAIAAVGDVPFNESVRVDWEEYWAPFNTTGQYYSRASQDSTISASGTTARGSVAGTGSFEFWGDQSLSQSSSSHFDIDFTIDVSCTIFLTGVLDLFVDTGGSNHDFPEAWVILSGQSGQVFAQHLNAFSGGSSHKQQVINEAFDSLAVGQYHLAVYAQTLGNYHNSGNGGAGNASFDITLVPEPSAILLVGLGGLLVLGRRVRPTR
jgi:hypothetical protein